MIFFKDPPRLFEIDTAPRELCKWLEHARHDSLSAAATEQLIQAVEGRVSATFPSLPEPSVVGDPSTAATLGAGSSATTGALVAKVLVTLAAIGVGAVVWYALFRQPSRHSSVIPPMTESALHAAAPSATAPEVTAPEPLNMDGDANGARPIVTPVAQPARAHAPPRATAFGAAQPSAVRAAQPNDQQSVSPATSADPSATRADEYRLLRAARRALASDPGRALELTVDHSKQFPKGIMGQEREAIAIEALARLGRISEAKSRANRFFRQFPASPYRSHLEAIVSGTQGAGQ